MENKIPQKSFDAQMHIIRDVHFDVDKYKVDELYVINQKDPGYLSVQGKTVAQLREVNEHELKFKVLALNYDPKTGNSYNTYSIGGLRFTIDDIIDRQIEIERLLTETEAVVYLTSAIAKECAKDIIPEPINKKPVLTGKHIGDLSRFMPSQRKLSAAYKIDKDDAKELIENGPMKIVEDMMNNNTDDSAVDTKINRLNYMCYIPGTKNGISFICSDGSFAYELFDKFKAGIKVSLKCEELTISFRTSSKNITADGDTISIKNRNGTIKTVLHKDSFYKVFDIIRFEP